jgi:hypothetical protein
MYVVIEKETNNVAIIKENKSLSLYLGCSVSTITNKSNLKVWEWNKFTIYKPTYIEIKSKRGGNRGGKPNYC